MISNNLKKQKKDKKRQEKNYRIVISPSYKIKALFKKTSGLKNHFANPFIHTSSTEKRFLTPKLAGWCEHSLPPLERNMTLHLHHSVFKQDLKKITANSQILKHSY